MSAEAQSAWEQALAILERRFGRSAMSDEERAPATSNHPAAYSGHIGPALSLVVDGASRLGGVSVEAVHRSASGVGRIRASTQEAILAVAASANGHG